MDATDDAAPPQVRPLGPEDAVPTRSLGWEAFGSPPNADPAEPAPWPLRPGMHGYGVFGPDGDLLARMIDREYDSWFSGVTVPTSGIAGVTVAAEHRGRGLLTPLFAHVLGAARRRGAVLSTLFPTAPRIYRRFGYEIVGSLDYVDLPTTSLAAVRAPDGLVARRATGSDVPAVKDVYDAWASAQNGPLTRRGPSFPDSAGELLAAYSGITVAVDAAGGVHGYASWSRGPGYGTESLLEVSDLVSTRHDAAAVLLRTLGSFASVTPTTRLRTSGGPVGDVVRLHLPSADWRVAELEPYMLRLLDPEQALTSRRYPHHTVAELTFTLSDEFLRDLDGTYRLTVRDGEAHCRRTGTAEGPCFTGRGLAMLYAGAQGTANLRMAGLLEGDDSRDATWDSLFGGHQVHIRDYF
ncbi:MAG: GNAT family N-acetyltransferase [Nocardioidaceae bacterium]|nr:GNAT family N-acetyltransferase [Nocardioidaceae bacterium]